MSDLICIDLDGVLVSTPVIPLIASASDIAEEIEVLTTATMEGLLPFARSPRLRCRLLRDIPLSEATRRVRTAALNHDVVNLIAARPDDCVVVSGLPDVWVAPVAERLGCRLLSSASVVEGDFLVDVPSPLNKGDAVAALREDGRRLVAVGTDAADVGMLEQADVRIAFGWEPSPAVREIADYWVVGGGGLWRLLAPS